MGVRPRRRKPKVPLGDPNDPHGFGVWATRYIEWLRVRGFSERTAGNQESYLGVFIAWCEARSITRPHEITKPILDRYQRHLFYMRKPNGRPLTFASQARALTPVRGFFKWLTRSNVLLSNPASEIELPKQERRLPKHVLTVEEAERVIDQPDVRDPFGIRDRAILEVLYSTGIRRMEVINLRLYDLDAERGTLVVRQGKGRKDRVVPIGERAISWVTKYIHDARPQLVMPPDEGVLLLTQDGEPLSAIWLTQVVRRYIASAEIGKSGSCHIFRHTCATLMLEHGADVRLVQEMLGHARLTTTAIYTHVSIKQLKAVHTLTHPGAKIERPKVEEKPEPSPAPSTESVLDLQATLDAEADEEALAEPPHG